MVQSRLEPKVNYPEVRKLDPEDADYDADLYESQIDGVDVVIALGQTKYTFIQDGIVYFPVYIIKEEEVDGQIGLYEVMADRQPFIADEDGEIDINKLGEILLYSYVNAEYLESKTTPVARYDVSPKKDDANFVEEAVEVEDVEADADEAQLANDEAEQRDVDDDDDDEEEDGVAKPYSPLTMQDAKQAAIERGAYKQAKSGPWIAKFMHNNNFAVVENEGGGDCLFAAIRDGLARVGVNVTVERLREILANEADEKLYQGYRDMYRMAEGEVEATTRSLKELQARHRELKKRATTNRDRDIGKQLVEQAQLVADEHKTAKLERQQAVLLLDEFRFMKGVTDLDKFRARLQTCDFWGETWAISTLERVLKIKLILFSERAYKDKDTDNVLQCGQLNDDKLAEAGSFSPRHYIMLEYLGDHYRLITYKGRGAFTFAEVPYDVKQLVVDKCLERAAGPFYLIPDFRKFMSDNKVVPQDQVEEDVLVDGSGLYDGNIVLQFYSKSANAPAPGRGAGEKIPDQDRMKFAKLAGIPEWRKALSNFHIAEFELDGHRWASVEHYYQASKFKENNPEFYASFSLDMNPEGELSKDPAMAKGAGGKSGKYKGKLIRPKEVTIDPNFFGGRSEQEMKAAQRAKFSQNSDLKDLLLATRDAKLVHFSRGAPPVVFDGLMEVRRDLARTVR